MARNISYNGHSMKVKEQSHLKYRVELSDGSIGFTFFYNTHLSSFYSEKIDSITGKRMLLGATFYEAIQVIGKHLIRAKDMKLQMRGYINNPATRVYAGE